MLLALWARCRTGAAGVVSVWALLALACGSPLAVWLLVACVVLWGASTEE